MQTATTMGHNATSTFNEGTGTRIPPSLQAIFMASNQGGVVDEPPKSAFQVFEVMYGKQPTDTKGQRQRKLGSPSKQILSVALSPHEYLDKELAARGYSVQRYTVINSGYSNLPTPLQLASYDAHLFKIIQKKDRQRLREIFTCGLSPNACNQSGDSILHKLCRLGYAKIIKIFLECGADTHVSNGRGRTLLHDACAGAKPFKTFELILQQDVRLIHMMDTKGDTPLTKVRPNMHGAWNMFLKTILDKYWPPRDPTAAAQGPPPLSLEKACCFPVANPHNALALDLATLVAKGRMDPEEALKAQEMLDGFDDESTTCTDYSYLDDDDTDFEFDVREMEEITMMARRGRM